MFIGIGSIFSTPTNTVFNKYINSDQSGSHTQCNGGTTIEKRQSGKSMNPNKGAKKILAKIEIGWGGANGSRIGNKSR
jgi:hypothetical protein